MNLEGRTPPVALVLSKVAFKQSPDKNLLPASESIIVAQVLETPTASESVDVIYTTATNELRINGTGFAGAKSVDFYFDPPLYKEVGYEVVTKFPTFKNQITLRLRHGYKWRDEPGPLNLVGIDTGGGPVKLNGELWVGLLRGGEAEGRRQSCALTLSGLVWSGCVQFATYMYSREVHVNTLYQPHH